MTTTDIPDRLPMGAVRLMGSWFNKLLDAVRRRTIIQGNGIRTQATPNGVIISASSSPSAGVSKADGEYEPWDIRINEEYVEIYLPQNSIQITAFEKGEDNILGTKYDTYYPTIVNTQSEDSGWYKVCKTSNTWITTPSDGGHRILALIYKTQSLTTFSYRIAFGVHIGSAEISTTATIGGSWSGLYHRCIGTAEFSDREIVSAYSASKENTILINDLEIPETGWDISFSATDSQPVSEKIIQLQNRMPSGTGAIADLSDDIPLIDYSIGSAGSSTDAARADHQHPMQVDDSKPPEPIPVWNIDPSLATGGEVGSSTGYARADHIHPFPPIVANEEAQYAEGEEWYLDMMPDGEGGSVTGASPSDPPVEIGSVGSSERAAPIDHSHPLNVTTDTSKPKAIIDEDLYEGTGSVEEECLGKSREYARADHTHVISGVPWLANNPDLPTGATDGVEMMPDEDSASGSFGYGTLAAPIDHRHPMNLNPLDTWISGSGATGEGGGGDVADGCIFPIGGTSAFFGISPHYCREDHRHPLPTDGIGANGIVGSEPYETADSQSISAGATSSGYGAGYNATWDRNVNFATGGTGAGFQISVVNKISYNPSLGYFVAYFRTLTFDAYGLCKNVSEVKCAQISGS